MKAVGRNLIVKPSKVGLAETKGGLFLAEKQREDIRYAEGEVLSVGSDVVGIKEKDIIYYDKAAGHSMLINDFIYTVISERDVVVVV